MEAKRELRLAQVQRRRRDNMLASLSALVVVVLAVVLQLTTFVNNPTVAEMAAIEESMEVPSSSRAPTPGTSATATPSSSPSPSSARSTSAAQSPTAASAGKTNSGPVPPASLAAGQSFTGTIATNFGAIDVKLNGDKAPQAVSVFKTLAEKNYFKGKSCHRLTTGKQLKVLQCGSKNGDGASDPQYQWGPVENTPADGKYPAGTIAVARGSGEYSHGRQFFIVYEDSTIPPQTGGYTVMGQVTGGLDVVKEIAAAGIKPGSGSSTDGAPAGPVTIDSFTLN
ncbi:peptidylprolyl isomerase [Arthrobacter castelli]|uniref:peptidylprolyl isomerase n=1 Tax=Arthrobacter castelli TaxID=271431 RepID=UPI000684101E|nr:peptidylprolyl isomerase [Arthrobacter castelli]